MSLLLLLLQVLLFVTNRCEFTDELVEESDEETMRNELDFDLEMGEADDEAVDDDDEVDELDKRKICCCLLLLDDDSFGSDLLS